MDKISIVVPVFNAEHTLRRCVESLVLGKYKEEIEIILVDDQSKDNSWDLCLELQNAFVQVHAIRNSENSGPSYTRNRGMEAATGNLLLFVDSDDWVSRNCISSLHSLNREYEGSLVLCGYKFIVDKTGERKDYLFSETEESIIVLDSTDRYFKLLEYILLQQIWNKIFDLQVIKTNKLLFDENQSMGEDTQFVLDYLRAADPKQCVIKNEPLYYYVRTEQSLMANYRKVDLKSGEDRLKELLKISGKDDQAALDAYQKAIEENKRGLIYRAIHSELSKGEKLRLIEKVYPEDKAGSIYIAYNKVIHKEKLASIVKNAKSNYSRLKSHFVNKKQHHIVVEANNLLNRRDFTVISQNCIGGVFCHDMGMEFSSPTVNLFFKADDFVRFALNLEHYMSLPLCMEWGEEYPVGRLDDVSIFFMHYTTCKEASEAWERRKQRMDYSHILILCTDMEGFTAETFDKWNQISYPKLLFTANKEYVNEGSLFFPEYAKRKQVPDLIPGRQFYKDGKLIRLINQFNWE